MEARVRRKDKTSKRKAKAKNASAWRERVGPSRQSTDNQQSSSTAGVRSLLGRLGTWLHHAALTLKQSIMGNQSWPVVLVQIGLWLLLLWLLSNLHMGLPCFLLALVAWLYNTYGGGPPLPTAIRGH